MSKRRPRWQVEEMNGGVWYAYDAYTSKRKALAEANKLANEIGADCVRVVELVEVPRSEWRRTR